MKLQEGGCGVAGTSRDFAGFGRSATPSSRLTIKSPPKQPGKLLGKFGRTACEQSGRLGLG